MAKHEWGIQYSVDWEPLCLVMLITCLQNINLHVGCICTISPATVTAVITEVNRDIV